MPPGHSSCISPRSKSRGRVKRPERSLLPELFASEAKALVAVTIPTGKMSAPYRRLMALRAVEKAFRELGRSVDVTLIDHAVLDKAAAIILGEGNEHPGSVAALAQLALEITDKGLTVAR